MSRSLARVMLVAVALAATAGCNRRPQLVPASADSTRVAPDSFAVAARQATDRWEAGQNEDAAAATAKLLLRASRLRLGAPWAERLHGVLDSLGIAAEVAGGDRAIVVNLFSRADPDGPSWPYLFWREANGPRFQNIEGGRLKLEDVATRGFTAASLPADSAQAAVLWGKRVGGGQQPIVMIWRRATGGRWDLAQTLSADSLGGTGSGQFSASDSAAELTTRTFRATPYFDECATCPHVYHERRFVWSKDGFHRLDDRLVPSPYSTFAAFVAALVSGDRDLAATFVVDPSLVEFARRLDWQTPSRGRWRVAPSTDESAITMVFFRGQAEAFRLTFESRDSQFVIAGFQAIPRGVE
jgi:hypothetical protein